MLRFYKIRFSIIPLCQQVLCNYLQVQMTYFIYNIRTSFSKPYRIYIDSMHYVCVPRTLGTLFSHNITSFMLFSVASYHWFMSSLGCISLLIVNLSEPMSVGNPSLRQLPAFFFFFVLLKGATETLSFQRFFNCDILSLILRVCWFLYFPICIILSTDIHINISFNQPSQPLVLQFSRCIFYCVLEYASKFPLYRSHLFFSLSKNFRDIYVYRL